MAKLKITEKQYNTILLREQQARLIASNSIINESLDPSTQLIEEGWREVVLGVAMMLGVGLSGQNKIMAQNATKNAETMSQIKSTLEDTNKLKELVDLLKEKGMNDPASKLSQNAEKVMDKYNKISADEKLPYKVNIKVVDNLKDLTTQLDRGYALTKADVKTDTINSEKSAKQVTIKDTIDVDFGDGLFITGGFSLSEGGKNTIIKTINSITEMGGKILSVEIESSTDAEEIVKFKNDSDPTGNIKLAELRTKSIADEINTLISDVSISHREIPNNGSHDVSTQDFLRVANNPIKTKELREKTSKYRYVKIKIIAEFESKPDISNIEPPEIIKNYRFELVRVINDTGKTNKIKTNTNFKNKKIKCSGKDKHDCYTF